MGSSSLEPKELGTLVVVVGKAKNLVNKSRFGKQDPFCTVAIGEDKQRTKPIKRGGQHPEWDEELRFAIVEDLDDVLVRSESQSDSLSSSTNGAPPPPLKDSPSGVITSAALANKSRKGPLNKKGGKSLKVACYADDAKEPELIGECVVNIDDVLKKGEVDEWYDFLYKDKYSGEVYLELTFFSNNAPPVKRNVPRPAIHNYGGAGTFNASPSGTLASAASRTNLGGGLTASGSVSGMSLYIPPYAQQGRAPSPSPNPQPPIQTQLPPSNSFADLGLPPGHRVNQGLPPHQTGQPTYPPSQAPSLLSHDSQSSIDALTRPMSSMSIGTSYSSRPLAATPAPPLTTSIPGHGYGAHRHSVGGGSSDAPWAQHLPQAQPAPTPTPHPRPMSSNDAVPWEQAQRLEQERLQAGATPVPRPTSGGGYGQLGLQQYPQQPFAHAGNRIPSTIPESLRPAGPPQPEQHIPLRAHSFSTASPAPINTAYTHAPPTPAPPPPSNSAPPISPSTSSHYHMPTNSFSALTQPVVDPLRAASPAIGQYPQANGSYVDPNAPLPPLPQQSYHTPTRNNTYPPRPAGQDYQQTPPHVQSYSPAYPQTTQPAYQATPPPQAGYAYNQTTQSPASQIQPPANDSGYVPWYQQTQSAQAQATPPQPVYGQHNGSQLGQLPAQPSYGQLPPTSSYASPPPVPQSRPQPPPPRRQSVGYYPSDELYAQQRQDATTPQPQQAPWQQGHQSRLSYDPNAHDAQRQQAFSPVQPSPYAPPPPQPGYQGVPAPSPPRQSSWQNPQNQYSSPQQHNPTNYYPQQPPPVQGYNSSQPPQNDYRAASPQPPPPQNDYNRAPSPQPYSQVSSQSQVSYGRSPSPSPQPYQPETWQNQAQPSNLIPPQYSNSPNPLPDHGRAPSPSPAAGNTKKDWRSYMNSLSTTGSGGGIIPARTPSPQPPPKDPALIQQQQQWYTPPPSLPNSIVPPEGWRSTLPAQKDGHAWRG
ncbi:hypothetical protein I302_107452 [Kwoniella bestiolae CBS 10118]|uniref:C2 domain-containing protein n=1 Tax=Kwoniella bestiolae CBS 10118 TaxID=1296100 RepID=A0A1B9FYH8_9TREE|nr:hypothetical protein I302_06807 [Kwoniella bestiolae CBS 10118]OCF23823.1 hypothetical protein I302_06807 [Kwoniella bestiolae CBS 10118]